MIYCFKDYTLYVNIFTDKIYIILYPHTTTQFASGHTHTRPTIDQLLHARRVYNSTHAYIYIFIVTQ